MRRRNWIARIAAPLALVFALFHAVPAFADQVGDLTQLLQSSSEKTRLSAVAALIRLGDKRTLKPLVGALRDPNAKVRALAATGLGRLGHKAALPSLRGAATDDTDPTVRQRAHDAAVSVAKANNLPDELSTAAAAPEPVREARHSTVGFGHAAHAVEDRPDLYVLVKSSSDDSPGHADKSTRKVNSEIVQQVLTDAFKAAPQVTMAQAEAQRWGLDARHIDLSVVKMDVNQDGGYVEIDAELRLAISDDTGKMLSFLSGGAKVQVPKRTFNPRYLPDLRKEALENAMKGMFDKLLAHLRQTLA
jgi:hypothetical protein